MFTLDTINNAIVCYHKKIAKKSIYLLDLYEFGFNDNIGALREINILKGYKNTLERYIRDGTTLEKKQVLCLLIFCDGVSDQESGWEIRPMSFIIPPPLISLYHPVIIIVLDYVPPPSVFITSGLELVYTPPPNVYFRTGLDLIFVPPPNVLFGIALVVDFVPVPNVLIKTFVEIEYVPAPIISFKLSPFDLKVVPDPTITFKLLDVSIEIAPSPIVTFKKLEQTLEVVPSPSVAFNFYEYILEVVPAPTLFIKSGEPNIELVPTPSVSFGLAKFNLEVVPAPIVSFESSKISIEVVPTPSVSFGLKTSLEFVPAPIVSFILSEHDLKIVPAPIVTFKTAEEEPLVLVVVPPPLVRISTKSVIDSIVTVAVVPPPNIFVKTSYALESIFVPPPSISTGLTGALGELYYFGIISATKMSERPTSGTLNMLTLSKVVLSTNLPDDLHIKFPTTSGFAVFALQDHVLLRKSYYISDQNKGIIGGSHLAAQPNLFSDPITLVHDTKPFKVYISSYVTQIDRVITVRAAEYNPRYQSALLPIDEPEP